MGKIFLKRYTFALQEKKADSFRATTKKENKVVNQGVLKKKKKLYDIVKFLSSSILRLQKGHLNI